MALTGFWVTGKCYATLSEAVTAFNATSPIMTGQYFTAINASASGASSMAISTYTLDLVLAPNTFVVHSFTLPLKSCDPAISTAPFFDGMTMGWGVVSAMAAAAAIIFIKKAFYR